MAMFQLLSISRHLNFNMRRCCNSGWRQASKRIDVLGVLIANEPDEEHIGLHFERDCQQ